MDQFEYIINVDLKQDGSKSGRIALKAETPGGMHSNIRILKLENDKIVLEGWSNIKMKDFG